MQFTNIQLEYTDIVNVGVSDYLPELIIPLGSVVPLPTSSPPPSIINTTVLSSGVSLLDLNISAASTQNTSRFRIRRIFTTVYHATRRLNLGRLHYHRGRSNIVQTTTEREGSSITSGAQFTQPAQPFYETAMPILSSSSVNSRITTTRFFTNWNPVRIRRDTADEHRETQRRARAELFRRHLGVSLGVRSSRSGNSSGFSGHVEDSDSDLLTFLDLSESGSNSSPSPDQEQIQLQRQPVNELEALFNRNSTGSEDRQRRQIQNSLRPRRPGTPIARRSTFTGIVRFSFRRTRRNHFQPITHPTPVSAFSRNNDEPLIGEDLNLTTSTASSSKDPVKFRRKTFRYSVGRNRDLYRMLGSFDDFHKDPLSVSHNDSSTPGNEENAVNS